MAYQSILGAKTGIIPNSGGKANPFLAGFKPGQYYVDQKMQHAMQAAQTPYAPVQNANSTQHGLLGAINKIGHFGASVGKSVAQPFQDLGAQANKNIIQPTYQSILKPQHNGVSPADIAKAQAQARQAQKAGKISPQTISNIGQISDPAQRLTALKLVSNPQKTEKDVQNFVNPIIQRKTQATKQGLGNALQIASYGVGAGEAEAASHVGAAVLKPTLISAGAGALGSAGAAIANNESGKQTLKQAAIGAGIGGALPQLGAALGQLGKKAPKTLESATQATANKTANQRLLGPGQKSLPAVTGSTKATTAVPGGVFGKSATEPAKVAQAAEKTKATVASIDQKLAAVDRGEIQMSPQERKDLFQSRQVLSGNAPAVHSETQGLVKTVSDAHTLSMAAEAESANPTLSEAVSRVSTPKEGKTGFISQLGENPTPNNKPLPITISTPNNAKGALGELKNLFTLGKDTKGSQTDLRSTMGELNAKKAQETRNLEETTKFFNQQSPTEHGAFIQALDTGAPQATPELQKIADAFKPELQKDLALARSIKPDTAELPNYFPHGGLWDNSKGEVSAFLKKWAAPGLEGKPSALESRGVPTLYDGIHAGLTPKETNPAKLFLNNRSQLLKAKAAQDFIKEQADKGVDPAITQKVVDRWLQQGLKGSATYRTLNDAATSLNTLQLGLSGFHFTGTAMNGVFSQFGDGLKQIEQLHPVKGGVRAVTSPAAPIIQSLQGKGLVADEARGITNKYTDAAHLANFPLGKKVDYAVTGIKKSLEQITSGSAKEVVKGVAAAPFRAIQTASKPLMEHWVPAIKAGAFKNAMDVEFARLGPNASKSEIAAAAQKVGDSIDNRFGQLTRDNIFWDAKLKDVMKVTMRSDAWNIGTVRELGGGVTDLLKGSTYKDLAAGKGLSNQTNYVASLAAGTALIGGSIQYAFTGVWPKSPLDYFYPRTGKIDKNGNPERVSLPTYSKDIFSLMHNPLQTVTNKATPLITPIKGVVANKDYFGNMVRNPDDSLGTQAKQVGGFLTKQALPFTVTNANQRVDKGLPTKAQSFMGLNPAPGYITKSSFEQKVTNALNQATGSKSLTPEEQALANSKSQAKQSAQGGDANKIQALIDSGKITQKQGDNLKKASSQSSLVNTFNYLVSVDKPAAARLINQASPQDLQKLSSNSDLIKSLQTTTRGKAKQSNKDAASKLLQALNK